jgi:hypothetical protein
MAPREMSEEEADALATALVKSDEMEETRDYLMRGRSFADTPDDA